MPQVAWKKFYEMAKKAGYELQLPKKEDRAGFRKNIRERYRLDPSVNVFRAVYVVGKNGKWGKEFFREGFEKEKANILELAAEASKGRELVGHNVYHYSATPLELVGKRLNKGQGTIEFVDMHEEDKLAVLFWKKVAPKKA